MWTPTNAEGELLTGALHGFLDLITGAGVDGVMVLGSTGEFIQCSVDFRCRFLEEVRRHAPDLPAVVNISHVRLAAVAELGRHARRNGAVAVACLSPWFFPMADEDQVEFFVAAGKAAELPLVLYNFPNLTGKKLSPTVVRAVATRVPVAALKHSGGEFADHLPFIEAGRDCGFNVMTGWDVKIPEAMAAGAAGCIGGLGNIVPERMLEIQRHMAAGRTEKAAGAARLLTALGVEVSKLAMPLNVAAAIAARGLEPGAPKSPVSPATQRRCEELKETIRALLREHGVPIFNAP